MANGELYFRGVPVQPDVDLLVKEFGELTRDGRVIPHKNMEKTLGLTRDKSRYRTVLTAYRKRAWDLYEVSLSGRRAMGEGYRCLTADETVEEAQKSNKSTTQKVRKSFIEVTAMPDNELDETHLILKQKYISLTEGVLRRHLAADAVLKDAALLSA